MRTNRVELLESELLRLWNEEIDEDEGDDVETSVESESSGGSEDSEESREGDGEDSRETQANRHSPSPVQSERK